MREDASTTREECPNCGSGAPGQFYSSIGKFLFHCRDCGTVFLYDEYFSYVYEVTPATARIMTQKAIAERSSYQQLQLRAIAEKLFRDSIVEVVEAAQAGEISCKSVSAVKYKEEFADIPDAEEAVTEMLAEKLKASGYAVASLDDKLKHLRISWEAR